MLVDVTTWDLEMLSPSELRSAFSSNPNLVITCAEIPCPEFNRFLYTSLGSDCYWIERLSWTSQRWLEYLDCPEIQTWVAYVSGTPAGFIELEYNKSNNVKIVYFGLLPQFIGQHIGGHKIEFWRTTSLDGRSNASVGTYL